MQLPSLDRLVDRFEEHGAQVVGISIDQRHANRAWAESIGITSLPLLSDFWPHGAVAEQYGVLRPEGMTERAVFIIDRDGIVRYIDVHDIREQPDEEQLFEELAKLA